MKSKTTQLLLLFLMMSLFSSSKNNKVAAKASCKIKCIQQLECVLQGAEKTVTAERENEEYPFALAPGNYMFRY
ncbi:MAG: hypothetical protein IPP72_02925 [Chitinophagaceae bacterium]|nr:hypothetical protein [Chitinophagaceae bacterium]